MADSPVSVMYNTCVRVLGNEKDGRNGAEWMEWDGNCGIPTTEMTTNSMR